MSGKAKKAVTIDDIAKACGVSKTTVSRYLNHRYDCFSEETRKTISRVISESGYNPNRSAQRLKSTKSHLIGCSIGDMSSPFAGLLLRGIMGVFQNTGYQVLFVHANNDPETEKAAIESLLANRVDGLIVNTSGGNDEYLVSIYEEGIPIVLADRCLLGSRELDTVELSNEETAYQCVKLLKGLGYEKVAFFTQDLGTIAPRVRRYEGYCRAVKDFFPGSGPELWEISGNCTDDWLAAIERFRARNEGSRISALTSSGRAAYNMVLAYMGEGNRFGGDFGLLSFDDWDWMKVVKPAISSVAIPSEEIGAKSAELLLEQIEHGRKDRGPTSIQLKGHINLRDSTTRIELPKH